MAVIPNDFLLSMQSDPDYKRWFLQNLAAIAGPSTEPTAPPEPPTSLTLTEARDPVIFAQHWPRIASGECVITP
jgi:hypothetical protein